MNISSPMKSANDSSNNSEDNTSSCQDESFDMNDVEEDDKYFQDDSDNNDNEKSGEDLLLALGEGYSEERNDLPKVSNQITVSPSKFQLPFLKKSQDTNTGLPGSLDILNLNAQLSKLVVPGTSESTDTNASTCLFLNNIYQTLLLENLTKVRQKLAENQEKQKVLQEKIKQTYKIDNNRPRKNVFCIPYFHKKGEVPKPNDHAKILQTWHHDKIFREKQWTSIDHELLLDAIHENAWEMTLKPFLQRLELYSVKMATSNDEEELEDYQQKIEDIKLEMEIAQQRDINEIIKEIDDDKFDWLKICNLTFNGKHSEFSCHLMWKNWLHPRLNKYPWTHTETKKLKELVQLHGRHQWKLIAEKLGTNRTPFHCLQHYRRKLDAQVKRDWTEEEDKILKEVIETCRIGDSIPWNQVSFYMEERSADSCGKRWVVLNPSMKRGRWTREEDSLLLAGVNVLGTTNWNGVKQLVPGRTASQCRERWINCLDPRINSEAFTYDEDKLLLKLIQKYGCNWSLLSSMLPGRTDSACRKQYARLKKWKKQSEYVTIQSEESKNFFINDFDAKHFADLVEANKSLEELLPFFPPSNDGSDVIWENQQLMLKRDLVRQEIDRRKGEFVVPRPLLLRKCTNNAIIKQWEHRKKMRQSIEDFIKRQMIDNKDKYPRKGIKKYTVISPKLDNLKPNTSVTEMLHIARYISTQAEVEKISANKRHLCANVDNKIKSLLYIDWLKEEMKDQPKLILNKSKASCEAEKYLDRLEGMTLIMTLLGMDCGNIKKRVSCDSNSVPLQCTGFMTAKELQNFREEYLLISQGPECSGNFSGDKKPKVEFSDTIPPNIHTLTAFRLLILERQKLQKSADYYPYLRKNSPSSDESKNKLLSLPEKIEKIKRSSWYRMLRCHFRSIFMWPALLSTLNGVQRKLGASKPYSQSKRKNKYPLLSKMSRYRKKKKKSHVLDVSSNSSSKKNEQIPKPCDESNSSETTATAVEQIPRKRGRPLGAVTKKRKECDPVPQRTSNRQREKKARLDSHLSSSHQEAETVGEQTLDKESPPSNIKSCPKTTKTEHEASPKTKDLLANVSPNLVQQVISQEVQVKPVGTYITVPVSVTNMSLWE